MKWLFLLIGACAPTAAAEEAQGLVAGGCYDPASYGAVPGGPDARSGIQAAVDAAASAGGGVVCLGAGRWVVTRAPVGSYDRFAALWLHGTNVTLRGMGTDATVLAVEGDQGAGTLRVVDVWQAQNTAVEGLTIDTSAATNTEEHTHAIEVTGPAEGTVIRNVVFQHPWNVEWRKGDCVQLIGNGPVPGAMVPADYVTNTRLVDLDLTACARSGIAVQRGVRGLVVSGTLFGDGVHDTPFDMEPTSYGVNTDVLLSGNLFAGTTPTYAVTITGWDGPVDGVALTGNVFSHQGVWLYRAANVSITGNVVRGDIGRVLSSQNTAGAVVVTGNVFTETAAATAPDYVVNVGPHGSDPGMPARWVFSGNVVTNQAARGGVYFSSTSDLTIANNDIAVTAAATAWPGVFVTPGVRDIDAVVISGNRISGQLASAVLVSRLNASYDFHVNRVSAWGNVSTGTAQGLVLAAPATTYTGSSVSFGNLWSGPVSSAAPLLAGQ